MIVTFPHMGNVYIGVKALMEDLGVDIVVPPLSTSRALEIGNNQSPEFICSPLKINIGNYIEGIEMGADTILITGSSGPCRFGYYGIVEKEILKDMGYDVDFIILEAPEGNKGELIERIQQATGTKNVGKIARQVWKAYHIIKEADILERRMLQLEAIEKEKGTLKKIRNKFRIESRQVRGGKAIKELLEETNKALDKVVINEEITPLKIGLVGEIYTLIEPFINLYVEEKLAAMGVAVDRSMCVGQWVSEHLFYRPMGLTRDRRIRKSAKPYLDRCIGGHAWETIGHAAHYCEKGYDGIIQLLPFGCMPEIVAESILPSIQKDYNIPIMTLVLDELTGEVGYLTRLEAFVDLIQRKRERREKYYG